MLKSSSRDLSFTQNLQPAPANSSNPNQQYSGTIVLIKTQTLQTQTQTQQKHHHHRLELKPKTNNRPTTHPDRNPKPKPNKRYLYPQRRRGDPYPPILISKVNQVYLCFLSFSPILKDLIFFKSKTLFHVINTDLNFYLQKPLFSTYSKTDLVF